MEEKGKEGCMNHNKTTTCTSVSVQNADVSVPIKFKPFTTVGVPQTTCCGEPTITIRPNQGPNCCCSCDILITQEICIQIPIEYSTVVDIGESCANYKKNPCNDHCNDRCKMHPGL